MSGTYPITGISAGRGSAGQLPIRRDVDEWWLSNNPNDINQHSLMIQAMNIFEDMDVTTKLSYFQIAGIHGLPLVPWDEDTKPVVPDTGYCTHGSILFPSWHRPYMLLVEQRLYEIMINQIIPTFAPQDRPALKNAADTWRLPFWDWATPKPDWTDPTNKSKYGLNVPSIVTQKEVQVRTPTGASKVRNPFWDFQMPAVNGQRPPMGKYGITSSNNEPFQDCIATSKWPPINNPFNSLYIADWVNGGVQDNQLVAQSLRAEAGVNALPEAVYRLFTDNYFSSYDAFASTEYNPHPPPPGQSLPPSTGQSGAPPPLPGQTVPGQSTTPANGTGQAPAGQPGQVQADPPGSGPTNPEPATTGGQTVDPNTSLNQNITHYLSLEGIHNNIHESVGGLGHMAVVPVAAFDPIFWLHHANVDRLYAIWQALYPDKWFNPDAAFMSQRTDTGTWTNPVGLYDTPQTALTPFHTDANGTYWNSDKQRDWLKLGYSYPELQPWQPKYNVNGKFNQAAYQKDIRAQIDRLYGSTSRIAQSSAPASAPASGAINGAASTKGTTNGTTNGVANGASAPTPANGAAQANGGHARMVQHASENEAQKLLHEGESKIHKLFHHGDHSTPAPGSFPASAPAPAPTATPPAAPNNPTTSPAPANLPHPVAYGNGQTKCPDLVVNVLYDRFALGGDPYTVHVILGEPPAYSQYRGTTRNNVIGSVYTFSSPATLLGRSEKEGCLNCKRKLKNGAKSTGQVVLTNALLTCMNGNHPSGVQLHSLRKYELIGALRENLHWRVTRQGQEVPLDRVPGLKVSVAMGEGTHHEEDGVLSKYSNYEVLWACTEGRTAGANREDRI